MKAPIWWLRNTSPNSIPTWRGPNMSATRPEVSGTGESQSRPIEAANTRKVNGPAGRPPRGGPPALDGGGHAAPGPAPPPAGDRQEREGARQQHERRRRAVG